MRRLLPLSVLVLLIAAALFAGALALRGSTTPDADAAAKVASRVPAPMLAPADAPARDADSDGFVYGYRSADALGAALDAAEAPADEQPLGAGQIRVTARVLPSIVVSMDDEGVSKIEANTDERDARGVIFVLPRELDAETWTEVRAALAEASAGMGMIWVR